MMRLGQPGVNSGSLEEAGINPPTCGYPPCKANAVAPPVAIEIRNQRRNNLKPIRSIVTRAAIIGTMAAAMFTLGGIAHAETANASWHKGKTGTLMLNAPTEIGGVLLQPGNYEVKPRKAPTGAVIEFALWTEIPYAQEALPVWSREVVATVPAVPQMLSSAPSTTGLLLESAASAKATGLQIRGDNAEYGF